MLRLAPRVSHLTRSFYSTSLPAFLPIQPPSLPARISILLFSTTATAANMSTDAPDNGMVCTDGVCYIDFSKRKNQASSSSATDIAKQVDDTIANNKVVVYSKTYCPCTHPSLLVDVTQEDTHCMFFIQTVTNPRIFSDPKVLNISPLNWTM